MQSEKNHGEAARRAINDGVRENDEQEADFDIVKREIEAGMPSMEENKEKVRGVLETQMRQEGACQNEIERIIDHWAWRIHSKDFERDAFKVMVGGKISQEVKDKLDKEIEWNASWSMTPQDADWKGGRAEVYGYPRQTQADWDADRREVASQRSKLWSLGEELMRDAGYDVNKLSNR